MPSEEIELSFKVAESSYEEIDRRFAGIADRFGGKLGQGAARAGGAQAGAPGAVGTASGGTWTQTLGSAALGAAGGAFGAAVGAATGYVAAGNRASNIQFGAGLLGEGNLANRNAQAGAQGEIGRAEFLSGLLGSVLGRNDFTARAEELRAQNDATFGVKASNAKEIGSIYGKLAALGVPYNDDDVKATAKFSLAIHKRAYDAQVAAEQLANQIQVPSSNARGAGMGQ